MSASAAPLNPPRKRGPLFWVLVGVASFLLLVVIAFTTIAYFAFQTAQQTTGLDTETMKKYPNFVIVKMQVVANSDNEILAEDMEKGEVRYRVKKTGQEFLSRVDASTNRVITMPLTPTPETK